MNRRAAVSLVVGAAIATLFAWIAMNTYWAEEEVEGMRSGEALYNPYYAAALLARQLGADARVEDAFYPLPPARGVLMLTRWNWDLYVTRRDAIRRWVESGGRLVIDRSLGSSAGFTAWSGIRGHQTARERDLTAADSIGGGRCLLLQLKSGTVPSDPSGNIWRLCEVPRNFQWFSSRPVQLALGVSDGYQLLRVGVGKGSVTAVNGYTTFTTDSLLDGDHARLLIIATQLHRGDLLRIVRGDMRISLPGWLWEIGAPVLLLLGAAIVLALWQTMVRFGPRLPPTLAARRSMHEQIAGTASFLARYGGGAALCEASRNALAAAAASRLGLSPASDAAELAAQVARLGGDTAQPVQDALLNPDLSGPAGLVRTLITLERARRRLQRPPTESPLEQELT
ncbi:MAG TPA: DUF4350 domain-containing protein [Steroidobacteraceae bacterium]|nr:DUF4350 domain-containing protein [Steroidobacteraceae bacterium]